MEVFRVLPTRPCGADICMLEQIIGRLLETWSISGALWDNVHIHAIERALVEANGYELYFGS